MITIGSLFSGIGGFELGLERAIPNSKTIWQVEQDSFCQKILKKHWPNAKLYNDVKEVGAHNLEAPDIICGGFPCTDLSVCSRTRKGIHDGKESSLWFEMWRIISELRSKIIILENVPGIFTMGIREVLGGLATIGYNAEWQIVSARKEGRAPQIRRRVFIVAYPQRTQTRAKDPIQAGRVPFILSDTRKRRETTYWEKIQNPPGLCKLAYGIPNRMDRLRALGNAMVPQCSEWVGKQILNSGLLNDLF